MNNIIHFSRFGYIPRSTPINFYIIRLYNILLVRLLLNNVSIIPPRKWYAYSFKINVRNIRKNPFLEFPFINRHFTSILILTILYKSWCFPYVFIPISSLSTSEKKEDTSFRRVYFLFFFSFLFYIDLILSYISHLLRFSVFTISWLRKKIHVFFIAFSASFQRSLKKCHIKHTDIKPSRIAEKWNSPSIFSTLLDDFPGWCLQLPLSPLPLLLFIIFDFLSFSPINAYSTVMRTIGTTKKKNVDNSNECLTRTLFTVHITIFGLL